jgi:3-hydroxybutyryl-CoA dehydratase
MGQADAFETDFWKHANLRKVWDDIIPGEPRKTIPYTLTREAIELHCAAVGENHPLYLDEGYARTTAYGGLIAPPCWPENLVQNASLPSHTNQVTDTA